MEHNLDASHIVCSAKEEEAEKLNVKLVCGADLLESLVITNLWLDEDIDHMVGHHGMVVISLAGSCPEKFIYDSDVLTQNKNNIFLVTEWITNEINSTKIRRAPQRKESVKYLIQVSVIDYLQPYDITVQYVRGKDLPVAYTLSRLHPPYFDEECSLEIEFHVHSVMKCIPVSDKKMGII
ncbi:hypothetical protein QYM36_006818 [Artemia franciscana]|uniref:Uncharacterized protein n=1 Tax=Artemia franciscana TaxID=6661 RepID=A0AA88HVD2_ARTSF|nr:hypothetical protein QYM36_006818 [Artemia franciscana]